MANYTNLKNAIAEVIRTNGNEEITGQILQNVLKAMVDSVGNYRTFGGIVFPDTAASTIDQNTFFMAYSAGVYTNFGGVNFNGVGILLLYNTPTGWQSDVVQLEVEDGSVTADKLAEGSVGRFALQDEAVNMDKLAYFTVTLSDAYPLEEPNIPLTQEEVLEMLGFGIDGLRQAILDDKLARVVSDESEMLTPVSYTGEVEDGDFDAYVTASVDGRLYKIQFEVEGNLIFGSITRYLDPLMFSVSYARLKALRDANKLIAGAQYRITNYYTTTKESDDYASIEEEFHIIVTATSYNTLNESARCEHANLSPNAHFAGCNLAAWEIKYSLDNDTSKYEWANASIGRGVIYWMRDEWGNEAGYDFKSIKFKQYRIASANDIHESTNVIADSITDVYFGMLKEYLGSAPNASNYHAYFAQHNGSGRFVTKSALSGLTFKDGWTPQDGDKYVKLSFVLGYDIVAKVVQDDKFYFTFDKRTTIDSDESQDYSLTGKVRNVKIHPYYVGAIHNLNIVSFVGYNVSNEVTGIEVGEKQAVTSVINLASTEQLKARSLTKATLASKYCNIDAVENVVFGTLQYAKIQDVHGGFIKSANILEMNSASSFSCASIYDVKIGDYCNDIILYDSVSDARIGDSAQKIRLGEMTSAHIADNAQDVTIGNGCIVKAGSYLWGVSVADYIEVKFGNKCQYIDVSCSLTPSVSQMCQGIIVEDMVSGTYNSHYAIVSNALSQEYPTRYRNTDTQINDFPASSSSSDETILTFVGKIIKKMTPTALINFIISKLTPTDFVPSDYIVGANSNMVGKVGSVQSLANSGFFAQCFLEYIGATSADRYFLLFSSEKTRPTVILVARTGYNYTTANIVFCNEGLRTKLKIGGIDETFYIKENGNNYEFYVKGRNQDSKLQISALTQFVTYPQLDVNNIPPSIDEADFTYDYTI